VSGQPHDFTSDQQIPNIWSIHDDEDDEPKVIQPDDESGSDISGESSLEEELEKPSFLRRLSRRKKDSDEDNN
jgi:hypothetical protein